MVAAMIQVARPTHFDAGPRHVARVAQQVNHARPRQQFDRKRQVTVHADT